MLHMEPVKVIKKELLIVSRKYWEIGFSEMIHRVPISGSENRSIKLIVWPSNYPDIYKIS